MISRARVAEQNRQARTALIALLTVLLTLLIAVTVVATTTDRTVRQAIELTSDLAGMVGAALLLVTIIAALLMHRRGQYAAGPVEIDCGYQYLHHAIRKVQLASIAVMSVVTLLMLGAYVLSLFTSSPAHVDVHSLLLGIIFAIYVWFLSIGVTRRLQVRANGIWHYFMLYRWEQITAYEWQGATLSLAYQPKPQQTAYRVIVFPPPCVAAVDALLRQHVAVAPVE